MRKKKTSLRVALAINKMYAELARASAKKAKSAAEFGNWETARVAAAWAEKWAKRAGGNALHWGLGV